MVEPLFVFFVGLFIVFTVVFWTTNLYNNDKFIKYIELFSVFSTIAIIFSFLTSLKNTKADDERKSREEYAKKLLDFTSETERNWIRLEQLFSDNYPYLTKLYSELYSQNSNIIVPVLTAEQQTESDAKEQHTIQILFQTIENIVNTEAIENLNYGWMPIFQSWLKSPKMKQSWPLSKTFFNPITNAFIDGVLNHSITSISDAVTLVRSLGIKRPSPLY